MHPDFARAVQQIADAGHTCFIDGPVGTGKREALIQRLRHLLEAGVPGYSILVLLPDRSATSRYSEMSADLNLGPFGAVELFTHFGLAHRLVRLFWPLVAADAGFEVPQRPPVFLNYETAQYIMGQLIVPLLAQGYFEGLVMRPQRVLSQLLDNLNKAAVNGYPLEEIEPRLQEAWVGEESRLRTYEQVQECIELFRGHCRRCGLLDFSLTVEVFNRHLVEKKAFWRYFSERFRHLLVDGLEESVPVAQDLIRRLLPQCDSALLACDGGGGYRIFLGADGVGAARLSGACSHTVRVGDSGLVSADISMFRARLGRRLGQEVELPAAGRAGGAVAALIQTRYRAHMLEKVADAVIRLVEGGVDPGEIAVVAPHADGVMRFVLGEAFAEADIPFAVVRRFESLREEPVVRACLSLAALAHPQWGVRPPLFDIAEALALALAPLDPIRAALVARHLFYVRDGVLKPGDGLGKGERERIGFAVLERYDALRQWLETYRQSEPALFDYFLRRLFGEVLSGAELSPADAAIYSKLIASATWFRQVVPAMGLDDRAVGHRYIEMIFEGVVAAQHLIGADVEAASESNVLVAPTYSYLLSRHVARYQFWMDMGSATWWEPLHQPLTHHHVLNRQWKRGQPWTDAADWASRNQILFRVAGGLCQRCRQGIYLCASELEVSGRPQDSPFMRAVQQVLQEDS